MTAVPTGINRHSFTLPVKCETKMGAFIMLAQTTKTLRPNRNKFTCFKICNRPICFYYRLLSFIFVVRQKRVKLRQLDINILVSNDCKISLNVITIALP